MLPSEMQLLNALEPMLAVPGGSVTLESWMHPTNRFAGIVVTPTGMDIVVSPEQ